MTTLSIDPGISTGIGIVDDSWEILKTAISQPHDLDQYVKPGCDFLAEFFIDRVVIENTPTPTFSEMNRELIAVLTKLRTWYPQAIWIRPGTWKTHAVYYSPLPKSLSAHEKDAVRLAYYVFATNGVGEPV